MTPRHEYWNRLRSQLWQPPRPHGEQPATRTVGSLELFYDLAVVVLVAQAAHHLAAHISVHALAEFAVIFTLIWIAWLNGTLHHELHSRDDARGRVLFLVQILALAPIGALIPTAGTSGGKSLAIAAGVLFALLAALWFFSSRNGGPEYRRPSRLFVAGSTVFAILLAATAFLPAGQRVLAWGALEIAYLAGFAVIIATATPVQAAALNMTGSLIERFGLLIIIVLGETVAGAVRGLAHATITPQTLTVALLAIVAGFGAWWTYFDFAGHRPPLPQRLPTLAWILAHLPLTAAVAALGAAALGLVEHADSAHTPTATAWALGGSAIVILATTALLTVTLQARHQQPRLYRPLPYICLAACLLTVVLSITKPAPAVFALALVLIFGIPWTFAVALRVRHPHHNET